MRGYFVVCFVLAVVFHLQVLGGQLREKGSRGPRLKYCRVSKEITAFIKQIRSGKDGAPTRNKHKVKTAFRGRQARYGVSSWGFNCLHAGYNFHAERFELPAYQCCKKCEWPGFSICWRKFRANRIVAAIRCNSDALRCISKCLCNGRSGGQPGKPGKPGKPGQPGPPGPRPKCQVKRKRIGGSYCLQRSCIRV